MLEGLEISEVQLFALAQNNEHFRIDSDYLKKDFLLAEQKIHKKNWNYLGNIASKIINFGAYSLCNQITFLDDGVPFLNVSDIKPNSVLYEQAKKIDAQLSKNVLHKSLVKEKQVLLTIAGTIGNAAVAYGLSPLVNSNQAIANIEVNNINPFFLSVYLNSFYGCKQTKRLTISSVQPNLLLTQVKKLKIFVPSEELQSVIENIYKKQFVFNQQSKSLYTQAEDLLLETLDLKDFKPSEEKINIKSFSESFGSTGRLDAEYYQKKYEHTIHKIKTNKNAHLVELVSIKKSIEPGSDAYSEDGTGLPFLRVADYNKTGLSTPQKALHNQFVTENKTKLAELMPKQNTILFSKDGSVGEAYCLTKDANFITSGAILHLQVLQPDELLPEYLTLVLNSPLVKMQSERDAGGSIILHWRVSEIEQVIVPIVDMPIQHQIASLIQQSFKLKQQSEHLLEVAKRSVEIAIEQDEDAALEYIAANSEAYNVN